MTSSYSRHRYHTLIIVDFWVLAVAVVTLFISGQVLKKFPELSQINSAVYEEPRQSETSAQPFTVKVGKMEYHITPLYDYELKGIIVSYNQNGIWWYFERRAFVPNYINIKDVCVLWGDNVRNEIYRTATFSNASAFACALDSYPGDYMEFYQKFNQNMLSNNHLLTGDKVLQRKLWNAQRGDQFVLKGYLVSYSYSDGEIRYSASSSTRRDDRENGACETIYVTDFKIIKESHPVAKRLNRLAMYVIVGCLGLYVWFDPYFEFYRFERH